MDKENNLTIGSLSASDFNRLVGSVLESLYAQLNKNGMLESEQSKIVNLCVKHYCAALVEHSNQKVPLEIIESWTRFCIERFSHLIMFEPLSEDRIKKVSSVEFVEIYNSYAKPHVERMEIDKDISPASMRPSIPHKTNKV